MKKNLAVFMATTCYSGFFPIAPGTVGALIAVVVLWFVPALSWPVMSLLALLVFLSGIWAADVVEKAWKREDPGQVNWDEVAGMMVSLIAMPKHWIVFVAAFILFRIFDVIKPWPVNRLERLHGGLGIMADDIMAGIYSNLVLQIILLWIWHPGM